MEAPGMHWRLGGQTQALLAQIMQSEYQSVCLVLNLLYMKTATDFTGSVWRRSSDVPSAMLCPCVSQSDLC